MSHWVYTFGDGKAEGQAGMKNLLGGKGANLAEMSNLGLPVPPGFTITTEVCTYYYDHGRSYPQALKDQVENALAFVGRLTGRTFGDGANPLQVSVRSGTVERGKKTRSTIKLGICGEHGGDPASIHFCQAVGLDYVSCSPYRVPIARPAAAQAGLRQRTGKTA
ncbi:hypothetical protein JO965_27090 (plasmid) [Microvirga sp. VF16]|nr:hypothetical protein JO965_27090 [Microvirga sp. VF16]